MSTAYGQLRISRHHPVKPVKAIGTITRQQRRHVSRIEHFYWVNSRYGLEPRRARRGIALALARKNWQRRVKP